MIYHMDTSDKSSLIEEIYYDEDSLELTLVFKKYYVPYLVYEKVWKSVFDTLSTTHSIGKFYLHYIKQHFKPKTEIMADKQRPKTKNLCSDEKRFIKMKIDVTKFNKDWFFEGEKGVYADITLAMLPDGDLDDYGNLGMVTQDVPKSVYEAEKKLQKEKKTRGPILGNGAEMDWNAQNEEARPGAESGKMGVSEDVADDLPF